MAITIVFMLITLFKEPLFKGYPDLRDKFLKISHISGEILGKLDEFWQKYGILR